MNSLELRVDQPGIPIPEGGYILTGRDEAGAWLSANFKPGDTATLDAVTNAIGYQAAYYPLITCWLQRPTESATRSDASYRWELIAEEV